MGERVGITPLDVEDRMVFPVDYSRDKAHLYGKILLRKESCEDSVHPLNLKVANQGLVVELRCSANSFGHELSAVESMTTDGFKPPPDEPVRHSSDSIAERLARIEELWVQGLIVEPEYEALRERVLNETVTAESTVDALHEIETLRAGGSISEPEFRKLRKVILEGL